MGHQIVKTKSVVFEGNPVCHGCWDLILNLSGEGTMTVGKQTLPFSAGTLFCVPPNLMHCKSSEQGYEDVHIYTQDFLPGYGDKEVLTLQDDTLGTLQALFLQMQAMFENPTISRIQLIEELHHVVLTWILLQQNANQMPRSVQEITTQLTERFADPDFSVVPLLQGYNYCPDYIRRLFKRYHCCSPSEYLTRLRLEHAKELLRSWHLNNFTIPQIALQSGFTDPNYFSRVFKKYTLLTPLQYVKQITDI